MRTNKSTGQNGWGRSTSGDLSLRERSTDGNHPAAVELLSRVDQKLAAALKRALDRKTQAADEARDIAAGDARMCVRQATALIEAARTRVLST